MHWRRCIDSIPIHKNEFIDEVKTQLVVCILHGNTFAIIERSKAKGVSNVCFNSQSQWSYSPLLHVHITFRQIYVCSVPLMQHTAHSHTHEWNGTSAMHTQHYMSSKCAFSSRITKILNLHTHTAVRKVSGGGDEVKKVSVAHRVVAFRLLYPITIDGAYRCSYSQHTDSRTS